MNGPPLTNMKELRISLHMTQEEFARSLGISKTTYNNYETGAREPGHKFIINVALKYSVTTDYLLGLSNNPASKCTGELTSPSLSPQEIEIALAYRKASADDRAVVEITLRKYTEIEQQKFASVG